MMADVGSSEHSLRQASAGAGSSGSSPRLVHRTVGGNYIEDRPEKTILETLSREWDSAPSWFIKTVTRVLHEQAIKDKISNLKYHLEGWREIIIPIHSVLIWQLPYYPIITWLVITVVFCVLYYLHLSVLTTLALLGIMIVLADYSVPLLQMRFIDPNQWDGMKERKFEEVCYGILCLQEQSIKFLENVAELKRTKPSMYFAGTLITLLLLAWIGFLVNNLFLTYVLVCAVAMLPGLAHRGYIQKYMTIGQVNSAKSSKQN